MTTIAPSIKHLERLLPYHHDRRSIAARVHFFAVFSHACILRRTGASALSVATAMKPYGVRLMLLTLVLLASCSSGGTARSLAGAAGDAIGVATDLDAQADAAALEAAQAKAAASVGMASAAEVALATARADALAKAAEAAHARAATAQAQAEAAQARQDAAQAQADRDRLGWWFAAAGGIACALAAAIAAVGWWLGLGRLATGGALALAVGGAAALALGSAWDWLPVAALGLLAAIAALVGYALWRGGKAIARAADDFEAGHTAPTHKAGLVLDQHRQGIHRLVARLRGKTDHQQAQAQARLETTLGTRLSSL